LCASLSDVTQSDLKLAGLAPFRDSPGVRKVVTPKKKNILVVNAYFDDLRRYGPSPNTIPQSMAPTFLAGAFDPNHCDVRIYNEHASGPIADESLLSWPDMLIMTGLTFAFDRMLHWAAYVRSRNPGVVVVAGGPAVRALPNRARQYFDYVCLGSVDEILEVIDEALGPAYRSRAPAPRYDLMRQNRWVSFVESSRYCNFKCGFCSLTAEGARYEKYDLIDVRKQIIAQGRSHHLCFIDNNFYGNDRNFFLARIELLNELRDEGYFRSWSALVTEDFFAINDNLRLARDSGCQGLFCGVESFDTKSLRAFNKRQNTIRSQLDLIRECLAEGIFFLYGMIFDLTRRQLEDVREELENVLKTPGLPLPSYCRLTIPLLGTPYFQESVANQRLLPNTRLRELDCLTLSLKPLDPLERVVPFVRDLLNLRGYRREILAKSLSLTRTYKSQFELVQHLGFLSSAVMLTAPNLTKGFSRSVNRQRTRTYVSTTEHLDPLYIPRFKIETQYQEHFVPTKVTDSQGLLSDDMLEDYNANGGRLGLLPNSAPVEIT